MGPHPQIQERTLVLVKPDAVLRGFTGKILARFEEAGLKVVAIKMTIPTRGILDEHFPSDPDWVRQMAQKTLEAYQEQGLSVLEDFGTEDPEVIGTTIKEWNYNYLMAGPVVAIVLEGLHAVAAVRKFIGNTLPYKALPGTIRGDYSLMSPDFSNSIGSSCMNLVHASGNLEEAKQEVSVWFTQVEICEYHRSDEVPLYFLGSKK